MKEKTNERGENVIERIRDAITGRLAKKKATSHPKITVKETIVH